LSIVNESGLAGRKILLGVVAVAALVILYYMIVVRDFAVWLRNALIQWTLLFGIKCGAHGAETTAAWDLHPIPSARNAIRRQGAGS
jgi:hypothetical protein